MADEIPDTFEEFDALFPAAPEGFKPSDVEPCPLGAECGHYDPDERAAAIWWASVSAVQQLWACVKVLKAHGDHMDGLRIEIPLDKLLGAVIDYGVDKGFVERPK